MTTLPTNPNRIKIYEALPENADNGATAKEIEAATGIKYSTVTGILRDLEEDGEAAKFKSGRQTTWSRRDDRHTSGSGEAVDLSDLRDGGPAVAGTDASSTGAVVVDEVAGAAGPVPVRVDDAPAQTAVDASDGLTVTDVPADPGTAATAPVVPLSQAKTSSDVLGAMSAIAPLPDAPAETTRAPRTRSAAPAREVRNDFGSGGLQGEILRWMDHEPRNDDGSYREHGPYEIATAVRAHASSVSYSLKQTTKKGQTVQVNGAGEKPRFRLVTAAEATVAAQAETS